MTEIRVGWEPIPGIAGASGCPHPTRLLIPICWHKRGKARQVDGAGAVVDEGAFRPSGKNAAVRIVEGLAA